MLETAKIFFTPKGILITVIFVSYICFVGIKSLHFSQRLAHHDFEYGTTQYYYRQPICQDSAIKSRTEGKNKCDEYAVYLSTSSWQRALMDVFESIWICSDGGCSKWFGYFVVGLVAFSCTLCYMVVYHTAETASKIDQIKSSLPFTWGKIKKYE